MAGYDPREFQALRFHDVVQEFRGGRDTPRIYLARRRATIAEREPLAEAYAARNMDGAPPVKVR